MHTRRDDRAAVRLGGVGERQPDRQVLLRLDERVPVVLVPWEPARLLGLLVDGLVPVEVDVRPEQVGAQIDDRGRTGERTQQLGVADEVNREGEGARLGDHEPLVGLLTKMRLHGRLVTVDLLGHRRQRGRVDETVDDEPTLAIELCGLPRGDAPVGRLAGSAR